MERLIWRKPEEMAAALASVGSMLKSEVCCLAQSVRLVTTTGSPSGVRRCQIFCVAILRSTLAPPAMQARPPCRGPDCRFFSAAAAAFRLAAALHLLCRPLCVGCAMRRSRPGSRCACCWTAACQIPAPQITHFRIISVCRISTWSASAMEIRFLAVRFPASASPSSTRWIWRMLTPDASASSALRQPLRPSGPLQFADEAVVAIQAVVSQRADGAVTICPLTVCVFLAHRGPPYCSIMPVAGFQSATFFPNRRWAGQPAVCSRRRMMPLTSHLVIILCRCGSGSSPLLIFLLDRVHRILLSLFFSSLGFPPLCFLLYANISVKSREKSKKVKNIFRAV